MFTDIMVSDVCNTAFVHKLFILLYSIIFFKHQVDSESFPRSTDNNTSGLPFAKVSFLFSYFYISLPTAGQVNTLGLLILH